MNRILELKDGIISGEFKRELENLFPELIDSFTRRKQFDEYYYRTKSIKIKLSILERLTNNLGHKVEIYYNTIIIHE